MRISMLGVRGSRPAPGPDTVAVGGQTSCIALAHDGAAPSLLLDGGTGLVNYPRIDPHPFRGTIMLGHLHWDHIIGLPFFRSGDVEGSRVRLLLPAQDVAPRELLDRLMSPPLFPIDITMLHGDWSVEAYDSGSHQVEGFSVLARDIPHKGGRSMGLRVSDGTTSLAYLSDHAPQGIGPGADGLGALHEAALELADGVDLLIHDAQHFASEFPGCADWGHSAASYAVRLGEAAGVGRVLLFHHDPGRTDAQVHALWQDVSAHAQVPVEVAVELAGFDVAGASADGAYTLTD